MNVRVKTKEAARIEEKTSDASARVVGLERLARREIHALLVPVTTEEVAGRTETISNAPAWMVGLERLAQRRRTFVRGSRAMTTGSVNLWLRVHGSLLGADVTLVMPAIPAKTTFARKCPAATEGIASQWMWDIIPLLGANVTMVMRAAPVKIAKCTG